MQTRLVDKPAFLLAGLAVDTSQAHQAADAGPLAARFFAPGFIDRLRGRTDPSATVALHANWNPDDETYRLMLGCEVAGADQPDGVEVTHIPVARYTVFTAAGPQPQASIEAWKTITAWRGRSGLVRTGSVSFEIHDARARAAAPEVDIYIPAVVLGEKIGEGAFADIHAWAPGKVVKWFKAGVSRRVCRHEARMTRAAFAAGVSASEVFSEVTLDGRAGIVLSRLDGPTLMQLSRTGAMTCDEVGAVLATLALSVRDAPPSPEVPTLREYLEASLRLHGDRVPEHIATAALALIDFLPPGEGLCHGDLHSGNVIMTAQGPRIVDWTSAVRAPAAFELAVCQILLCEIAPEMVDDPERPRAVGAVVPLEYARLAGTTPAAMAAALEPYLPIARVCALLAGVYPSALREQLIQRLQADLGTAA